MYNLGDGYNFETHNKYIVNSSVIETVLKNLFKVSDLNTLPNGSYSMSVYFGAYNWVSSSEYPITLTVNDSSYEISFSDERPYGVNPMYVFLHSFDMS